MRGAVLAAAMLVAVPAVAGPLDGRWVSDKAYCESDSDSRPSIYEGNKVSNYESDCEITEMTPIGTLGAAWNVEMQCSGEGEQWQTKSIFALHGPSYGETTRQMIQIDLEHGYVSVLQNCDG